MPIGPAKSVAFSGLAAQARTGVPVPGMAAGQVWRITSLRIERQSGASVGNYQPEVWEHPTDPSAALFRCYLWLVPKGVGAIANMPDDAINAQISFERYFTATDSNVYINPAQVAAGADLYRGRMVLERVR